MKTGSIHTAGKPCDVLTSENIVEVYGVKSDVHCHDGVPVIIPYQQIHGNGTRNAPIFCNAT